MTFASPTRWTRWFSLIGLLLVFVVICSSYPAAAQPTAVTGRVTRFAADPVGGGQGESGVTVTFRDLNGAVIGSDVTDINGDYSVNTGGLSRGSISASKGTRLGAYAFSGTGLVFIFLGGATRNITAHRPTIVMVAGYTGFNPPKGCIQTIPGRSYDPGVCPLDAFDSYEGAPASSNVPRVLSDEGYFVQIAVLESNVFATPSIASLVPIVTNAINVAKAATGNPKVMILAHSTGGIVSRRYIEGSGYRGDVSHLFTFGSPHLGAPIERIFAVLAPILGPYVGIPSFAGFCILQRAACDMSEAGMFGFNLSFQPNPTVEYHLIQGDTIRFITCFLGSPPFAIPYPCADPKNGSFNERSIALDLINDGDGLINKNSLNLEGTMDRLKTYDAHGWDFGHPWYMNKSGDREGEGYTKCIVPVFVDRSRSTCGTISTMAAQLEVTEETTSTAEFTPRDFGALNLNQTTSRPIGVVDDGYPASFEARWDDGGAEMTLLTPDGITIDEAYAASHTDIMTYTISDTSVHYHIYEAISGTYTLNLEATSIQTDTLRYQTVAGFQSDYSFSAGRNRNWYGPGEVAQLTATFSGTAIMSPQVKAYIRRSDTMTDTVTLTPTGPQTYGASYTVPDAPGYADVLVVATGQTKGIPFERARSLNFQIYPHSFKLNDTYSESATSEALTVTVGLNVAQAGPLRVTGILSTSDGSQEVAVATTTTTALTGTASIPLRFSGLDLYASGSDSPFRLSRVVVFDEREAALVSDDQRDVYDTDTYPANFFAPARTYIPYIAK